MNILADTHILLWAIFNKKELNDTARALISDPNNEIYYSAISVWEVDIKHKIHPDKMTIDGKMFTDLCKLSGFHPISFNEKHAVLSENLFYEDNIPQHKDPFDKALIAQAKAENFKFVTHDQKMQNYKESCILNV